MSVHAWQVSMWTTVRRTPRQWVRSTRHLRPISASINVDPEAHGLRYGQVLWGGDCQGEMVGIAWDWRELQPNVVAMSDPMTVLSNLQLVDDDGVELGDPQRVILLNTAIYHLAWQRRLSEPKPVVQPLPLAA